MTTEPNLPVVSKTLAIFNILVDCLDLRFLPLADQYISTFLDNANTGYAEVSRMHHFRLMSVGGASSEFRGFRFVHKLLPTSMPSSPSNGDQSTLLWLISCPRAL